MCIRDRYADDATRIAFAERESELYAQKIQAEQLLLSRSEALERALRLEDPWGGASVATPSALAAFYLERGREALPARDAVRAEVDPQGTDAVLQVGEDGCPALGDVRVVVVLADILARSLASGAELPIGVNGVKDNPHPRGPGMQQALEYAGVLDLPFAYSSNGDAFLEHDRTGAAGAVEREIALDQLLILGDSPGHIVEFGCGFGTFTLPAARRTTGIVTALDIKPARVANVRQKANVEACEKIRPGGRG